jgi:glycosyltransferase involved in cell wall biosynthesis
VARRILIDALAARYGGTAYAAVQLARQLARSPAVSDVSVVARQGSIVERSLVDDDEVKCVALPAASWLEVARRTAWETLRLPPLVAREQYDVVISMSGMLPRAPGRPVICLLYNPVMYESPTAANALRKWAVRRTAREARYVAAPSRMMAELATTSIGRECAVVPLGVDHEVFTPAPEAGDEILCVADFYPHKRHDLIIDTWLHLSSPRPRLRFVGNPDVDPKAHSELLARIATLPERQSIVLEYQISLDRLVGAYQHARLLFMASEHESFCMPMVESMACGVPVVARGLPSLRETGGAGASYVDGNDPVAWAAAVENLLENDEVHQRARNLAVGAAARFSWTAMAQAVAAHL